MSSPSSSCIYLILIGCGNVGRAFISQIMNARPLHSRLFGIRFEFSALFDSSGGVISSNSLLSDSNLNDILSYKSSGKLLKNYPSIGTSSLLSPSFFSSYPHPPNRSIIIDASATDTTTPILLYCINNGFGVVLANKKPITGPQSDWDLFHSSIDKRMRLKYSSTVGAGTPFISSLARLIISNQRLHRFSGTFSGTLGYLSSELAEKKKSFSSIVSTAKQLGYTEPDPRDDLSGMDVARKALILSRVAGKQGEMNDISIEKLYPDTMEKLSVDEFMKELSSLDDDYQKKVIDAEEKGCVLKYVANVENEKMKVSLAAVPNDSPLGLLKGTQNLLEISTNIYSSKSLVIQGAGAGADVTAAGILTDTVEIAMYLSTNKQ